MKRWILALAALLVTGEARADLFDQPAKLCNALASVGLPTSGWRASRVSVGEFTCFSDLSEFGPPGRSSLPSNIAYYVSGSRSQRADEIVVKINVNNPSTQGEAVERLVGATERLFKMRGEAMPAGLGTAIRNLRARSLDTSFGKAELIHEPGRIDSYKVVLTDRRFLQEEQRARQGAHGDFERCIGKVAQVAGYGASQLSGKGDPIEESGYVSFLINGRGKDIFFCEVHPGNKYRVRGALAGKFPFKLLGEGSF